MTQDELITTLRNCDTPTVCNAIEYAQGQRGFSQFTKSTMMCSAPDTAPIVGFARTAKIAGRRPAVESADVITARRLAYYRSMAAGQRPAVAVIEDLDHPQCVAAWWGEIHATIHKGLGMAGALTNGVMRDLGDLDTEFPIIAGSVGPSHGYVHVREIGAPVDIFGMTVNEGDLVHGDRHGAVVIPTDVIPVLATAIEKVQATEKIVLEPARRAGFDIDKLESAWAAFERSRV